MSKISDLELQQTFNFFKRNNETMALQNLIEAFSAIGIILSKEELKEKEKEFETNKGFSFNDYKSMYDKKYNETSKDEILKSFKVFDPDGSGVIKEEQFNRVMTNYGDKFSKNEYKIFMEKYDKVKDGDVHYEDIVNELTSELN
jgi:Ca2+-binding EF-hand superfamily protein